VREITSIPAEAGTWDVDTLAWSPGEELLSVSTDPVRNSVTVWALRHGEWVGIGQAEQHTGGRIIKPRLYVRPDGTSIVTWEDFYRM
jgi:hypothetical protein